MITDEGEVKLLDFGIAKLLRADLYPVDLAVTQTGLLPMTPEYASPEQVRGDVVTTASDVYSLAVVLYELLTGHRPYKLASRSPLELERAICDTEPERPSTIINQTEYEIGKDGTSRPKRTPEMVSQTRKGKPDKLRARLRGDLDSITLKALRKEPQQRYQSVEQFSADIRRHLEGNTVKAQKATWAYRAGRFMRRHKVAATVAALFVLMLIGGIITTTWQARIARRNADNYRRTLYTAQMNLAGQAWDNVNLERLEELLEANWPKADEEDLRGFEWYYLWRVYHSGNDRMTLHHDDQVWSVALSPDGKRLASGGEDRTAKIWDAMTGQELLTLKGHTKWVYAVSFSPDGKRLATASGDSTAKLWDAETGQAITTLIGHQKRVNAVVFSPDGRRLYTASDDELVKVWDTTAGREIASYSGHVRTVRSLAISPDGKLIATGGFDSAVKLWDAYTDQELASFKAHEGRIFCLAFSPDSRRLATGGGDDHLIKIWEVASARQIMTLAGHTDWVNSVAFSSDGRMLASGSADLTAKLWDVATGREIRTFKGHADQIKSIAFSHNGLRLATASHDTTVRLWDVATGQELIALKGHTDFVLFVAFSDDDKILTSASRDQTIRFWRAATEEEVAVWDKK